MSCARLCLDSFLIGPCDFPLPWRLQVLPMLPQPSAGRLDGIIMLNNNEGAMFVYNPTASPLPLSVTLDSALGFDCSLGLPVIVNVLDSSDRGAMPHHLEVITCGGAVAWLAPGFYQTASVPSVLRVPQRVRYIHCALL